MQSQTVFDVPLARISPSPENDDLYGPVDVTKPDFKALVQSVKEHGIKEPLVLTLDNFILSGHRRYAAARRAGIQEAPCRFENIYRSTHDIVPLLREYNRQRVKTLEEQLREQLVDVTPDIAYEALLEHRNKSSQLGIETVRIEGRMHRCLITDAKMPMMKAILQVLSDRRKFWPLSDRMIHYALLNNPPLIHAKKPDSIYQNTLQSYKALTDLVTRARLEGRIPMHAIADSTRPVMVWDVHDAPATFLKQELDEFLNGYRRNLQQSQPNHIEIVGEKNTVLSTLRPVASRYHIPLTIGRGFASLEPRWKLAERYKRSGKEKLILLVLSDFDPSGEEICQSFARSLRDDFGIWNTELVKVALTGELVQRYKLPPMMQAKTSDSRAKKFTERHGADVYELEALPLETLQEELSNTIDSVLDVDAFNHEIDEEKSDSAFLANQRQRVHLALKEATG